MAEILLVTGRTKDEPVMVMAFSADLRDVAVVHADGTMTVEPTVLVSIDFHVNEKGQWVPDFGPEQEEEESGG